MNRRLWLKTSTLATLAIAAEVNFSGCGKGEIIPLKPNGETPIRLHSNESPYSFSPAARGAFVEAADRANLYPHRKYGELITSIAERENISPEGIILGAGSTGVMTALIHYFADKGEVIIADPTYFDFVNYAEMSNCRLNSVPLNKQHEHDLNTMESRITENTSMVYICNPKNPTGSITPRDRLMQFCRRASEKTMVIVDEAYHEYVEDSAYSSMIPLVREGKNVIVLRTFSKIFGMAGLRVGYGMAKSGIIEQLEQIERNFAPIAYPSLKAALAGYEDTAFTSHVQERNREVRSYLYNELKKTGHSFILSHTNFVFISVKRDSREMVLGFEKQNILIRPFKYNTQDWIRVSLGTMEQMRSFVSVLTDLA